MNEMMVIHYIHIGIIKNKEDFYFFDNKISIIPRFECFRIYIKIMTSISSIKSIKSIKLLNLCCQVLPPISDNWSL